MTIGYHSNYPIVFFCIIRFDYISYTIYNISYTICERIKLMVWNIEIYQKENGEIPLVDFINSLPAKHKAKVFWEIELLKEFGIELKEPYSKAIKGDEYKGLWELRIKFASDISRIFYFLPFESTFILLHGFVKKTERTPKKELEIAKKYVEDYLGRCKK